LPKSTKSTTDKDSDHEDSDADVYPTTISQDQEFFTADEDVRINRYIRAALNVLQQINCKVLCKAWIQMMEPSKQTKFPYNAKNKSQTDEKGRPRQLTPYWWPSNVPHKEPDHLKKIGEHPTIWASDPD